jgi:hypothetical protein
MGTTILSLKNVYRLPAGSPDGGAGSPNRLRDAGTLPKKWHSFRKKWNVSLRHFHYHERVKTLDGG